MNKKGQGISMETIVIAVIVIAVLAILLLVFAGRISIFGTNVKACVNTYGGECSVDACTTKGQATYQTVADGQKQGCAENEKFCCSKVTEDFGS